MGGSSSKPKQILDPTHARLTYGEAEEMARKAKEAALAQGISTGTNRVIWIVILIAMILGTIAGLIYYFKFRQGFTASSAPSSLLDWFVGSASRSADLSIQSAVLSGPKPIAHPDITSALTNKISNGALSVNVDASIGVQAGESLVVRYQYPGKSTVTKTVKYGDTLSISPPVDPSAPVQESAWFKWFQSEVSSNQLPSAKDATVLSTVPAASAPLSAGKDGAYSYQFWVYIKDWGYKFGQEKSVLSRSDPTNLKILNPSVTLHPTDNTLKISISVFSTSGGSSKSEPAPAGHSGSTDDVFICEVPNIPLQKWTSVSISTFSRNLDVYIDGKLVKSCVMSGVPKPAAGDIELNGNGGFSGWMCGFYHYSRMLTPSDAQTFSATGSPCSVPGTTPSNYSLTFGFFDTKGKEVNKYTF